VFFSTERLQSQYIHELINIGEPAKEHQCKEKQNIITTDNQLPTQEGYSQYARVGNWPQPE